MPTKPLNPHQKLIADRLSTLTDAKKSDTLRAELVPLRSYFVTASEHVKPRAMATEIVNLHPNFKGESVAKVTILIEELLAEAPPTPAKT